MQYRGSCHCGKVKFDFAGDFDKAHLLQLLDLLAQRGTLAVVRAARLRAR